MTTDIGLDPPRENLRPAEGSVDVFCARLDLEPPRLAQLGRLLSQDEQARAARFHFDTDRRHFIARHGILREILGQLLSLAPADLAFAQNDRGKPQLAGPQLPPVLQFNLSHSPDLALFAVSRDYPVGADVERIRALPELDKLVDRCCSASERALWSSLAEEEQQEFFFQCWTRKEAFLKANGEGIDDSLDHIEAVFQPDQPPQLARVSPDRTHTSGCWFDTFVPAPGYLASVAVRIQGAEPPDLPQLRHWQVDASGCAQRLAC